MDWKTLALGVVVIVLLGVGGLVYRNVTERSGQPVACPMDAKVCPDGTSVARQGLSCTFPTCPPPNTSVEELGITFAIPAGFAQTESGREYLRRYALTGASTTPASNIALRSYLITASTSAAAIISGTAIADPSGMPVPSARYTSTSIANRQYTVVEIGRFEGVIQTSYYLVRGDRGDVLRFDATDYGADWTNPALDPSTLPAHKALRQLLSTLGAD